MNKRRRYASHDSRPGQNFVRTGLASAGGAVLLIGCMVGVVYSACAGIGQAFYYSARYGPNREDTAHVLRAATLAMRVYPRNYYVCLQACERAYSDSFRVSDQGERDRLRSLALAWCKRGLHLNFYNSSLRFRWVNILEKTDVAAALRVWENYVDWHFWNRHNQSVLVDLAARSGEFETAERALDLLEGSGYFGKSAVVLSESYARSGEFYLAEQTLQRLEGTARYAETVQKVARAQREFIDGVLNTLGP